VLLTAAGLLVWLGAGDWSERSAVERARQIQRAEVTVRRSIGVWLRDHTRPSARVAAEPIGYIGYYSRRRILDEVGLVSPEMIPLNRAGAGWFAEMLRRFAPDYVVERPGYLLRNMTLNTGVPMFRSAADREEFAVRYRPVAAFATGDVPKHLKEAFRFVVYARRADADARAWRSFLSGLDARETADLLDRATLQAVALPESPSARAPAAPPPR
jgi:hypothetical protein